MNESARPVSRSRVEMTQLVLPQFANAQGHLFGGQMVSWIDVCAAVAAQRHAGAHVVTVSIDAVHFLAPVRQGHTVVLRGQVNAAFHTSMECGVSVWAEDPVTGERVRAAKAYTTFVALDDQNRPKAVPPLLLEDDTDRRRAHDAELRRTQRLTVRRTFDRTPKGT